MCARGSRHLWYSDTFPVPMFIARDWCVSCGERNPVPPLNGWTFSQHALERALDMALDAEAIREVLLTPKVKQPSGTGYEDGYEVWAGERIALVVHPTNKAVVTILWRGVTYERGTDTEPYRDN